MRYLNWNNDLDLLCADVGDQRSHNEQTSAIIASMIYIKYLFAATLNMFESHQYPPLVIRLKTRQNRASMEMTEILKARDTTRQGNVFMLDFKKPDGGAHELDIKGTFDRSTFTPLGPSI